MPRTIQEILNEFEELFKVGLSKEQYMQIDNLIKKYTSTPPHLEKNNKKQKQGEFTQNESH